MTFEQSVPDALRGETNDMLIRYVYNTLWHTSSICWRGIVFAQALKASQVQKPTFSSQSLYCHRLRKKNLCVLILYENRSYKTLGSSLCLVTVLRCDYSNGTSTKDPALKSLLFNAQSREKKKTGNRMCANNDQGRNLLFQPSSYIAMLWFRFHYQSLSYI